MSWRRSLCVVIVLHLIALSHAAVPEENNLNKRQEVTKTGDKVTGNGKPSSTKTSTSFECVEEDTECTKDKLGYEAIAHLHRLIDDDHNGNVDQSESDEFLRDELQYTDGFERHSLFHNNDKLISVDDLWRAWKFSKVYNWTVEDVVEWLDCEVELPQYANIFTHSSVTGQFLPRMATSNTFMSTILGIKNPVHKQKLTLKAMDTVLFGPPPKRHSYIKDLALVTSVIVALGGCWFALLHHRYSQAQVRKLMVDLESLQKAEDALTDMQRKLQDAESKQVSSVRHSVSDYQDGSAMSHAGGREGNEQIREELAATLLALQHAETQLEHSWAPPGELQAWLQLTHELEQLHYMAKRQAAERQFQSAKESCEKIKRRNRAIFGSLRMAHSNSLDEIDQRILDARMALEEVKQDLQERLQRWHTIERLCGFPVISNPGLSTLHQMLYPGKEGAGGSSRLTGVATASSSVDETEDDMRNAGYPSLPQISSKPYLRQRVTTMGSTGSLSQSSRAAVSMGGPTTSTPQPHPLTHRAAQDQDSSAALSGAASFVDGHSEQSPDQVTSVSYTQFSEHGRSLSLTPSVTSSVHSSTPLSHTLASHGYVTTSSAMAAHAKQGLNRHATIDQSDDNLSQTTFDSLSPSATGSHVTNGLEHSSHAELIGPDGAVLTPRLQKKPSIRKKVINMFKKTNKKS